MAATLQTLIIEKRWEKSEKIWLISMAKWYSLRTTAISITQVYIYTHVFVSFFLTRSPKFIYTEN